MPMQKWKDRGDRCGMCWARTGKKNHMEPGWALIRNQTYCPRHADIALDEHLRQSDMGGEK